MLSGILNFICGDDDYLIEKKGNEVYRKKTIGLRNVNNGIVIFANAKSTSDVIKITNEIVGEINSIPFLNESKVIWIRDFNFLSDNPIFLTKESKKQIEIIKYTLNRLKSFLKISIIITSYPVSLKNKYRSWFLKNSKFENLTNGRSSNSYLHLIDRLCLKLNLNINNKIKALLYDKLNGNLRLIVCEITKMSILFCEEFITIDEEILNFYIKDSRNIDIFLIIESLYGCRTNQALLFINEYIECGNSISTLVCVMQKYNRLLIQLKCLIEIGSLNINGNSIISLNDLTKTQRILYKYFPMKHISSYNLFTQKYWYLRNISSKTKNHSLEKLCWMQISLQEFLSTFESSSRTESLKKLITYFSF